MVSCIERAIEIPPESPHFSSAFDHLAPEALLLSASLQRIGIRTLPTEQGGLIPAIALTAFAREEEGT
jgi:hypothetical protein